MAVAQQIAAGEQIISSGTLPWQADSWNRLCASLASNRLAHAVLLSAPKGMGKRHFAEEAAALLLCSQPIDNEGGGKRACGNCKQCHLLAAGSHPDLRTLVPEDSRVIKIDQVRRLGEFCVRSPQVAGRKVAIVDSADRLNLNAANALLKTLEEPVEDVQLLLLHHAGEPVLPTIRSRCQALRLALPSMEAGLAWLSEQEHEATGVDIQTALTRARGAPLVALELLNNGQVAAGDECLESLRLFLRGERQVVEAVAPFVKLGVEPSLDLLGHWAFDAMKLALDESTDSARVAGTADGNAAPSVTRAREMFAFLAKNNPADRFVILLDQVTQARRAQTYNINPELMLTDILLSWKALMPRRRRAVTARMN
ncbi:DNA polymerase III subunit delta' [Hydrocarboniclastica marina]|uniref:DNA-directed DNA polymerase n=1 Tax=Hydrocarboniclastica marina TaxID=2259620 RepID=A0A4P7XGS6_9ALTE|nr:DNA polymerase III subunit delta' [Hydrocarboniclastica marina]QCF26221.1 DNA polymerase III subunit delta' [Hydrocarboniclastica marina]